MAQDDLTFEKALEKLDKIVQDLESGEISLEQALAKYEEGVRLSRACQTRLSEAEKKVEVLTRTLSGELVRKPFEPGEEAPPETGRRSRKSKGTSSEPSGEDILL